MKKHVVWQPHVETDILINPFVPPERRYKARRVDLDQAHRAEIEVEVLPPRPRVARKTAR